MSSAADKRPPPDLPGPGDEKTAISIEFNYHSTPTALIVLKGF